MQPYEQLENRLKEWAKVPNVAVCSTGTAALHLALESLQLPPGTKVLVPEFTFIACARAVHMAGLVPVFVDCDETGNASYLDLQLNGIHPGVKAIMAVHIYGRQCDIYGVTDLARTHGLAIVEDMAELHCVLPSIHSDLACWSFYRNKVIPAEEGGAVSSFDGVRIDTVKSLRSQGHTSGSWSHLPRANNYRMTDAQAKYVIAGLDNEAFIIDERRRLEAVYDKYCPAEYKMPARQSPWMYDLRIRGLTSNKQADLIKQLNAAGIPARPGFRPMTLQEEFKDCETTGRTMAETLSREMLYFSLQPGTYKGKEEEALIEWAMKFLEYEMGGA